MAPKAPSACAMAAAMTRGATPDLPGEVILAQMPSFVIGWNLLDNAANLPGIKQ